MKQTVIAFLVLASSAVLLQNANGENLVIESFNGSGQLVFNSVDGATAYRVEWTSSLSRPWTNFEAAVSALDSISATEANSITCAVPMFYRVVATFVPYGMVEIPGGTNAGVDPDFGNYSLTVSNFYMDVAEVALTQWDEVRNWGLTNAYTDLPAGSGKGTNYPAHAVSWYDCVKWCNARSEKEGRTPCYTVGGNVYQTGESDPVCDFNADGYRLPTNEEWEYAARGGLIGMRFPWGGDDEIDHTFANYKANGNAYIYDISDYSTDTFHPDYDQGGYPYTNPVDDFAANAYGLFGISGNVREWCWDSSSSNRSVRGGCWNNTAYYVRSGAQSWASPDAISHYNGFRTVCH